jgi:single-stranded DNA-binding protein
MSVNKAIIEGTVQELKSGPDHDLKIQTSFTLRYEQPYGQGQMSKLFLPVDVQPSKAEAVFEAIHDGDVVLVDGSLKWRSWVDKRSGEKQGKLAILAWNISVLQPAAVTQN